MTKKLKILLFLVVSPLILIIIYDKSFRYSGNWLEDYQNYFKFTFLAISIFGSGWLTLISKKEKNTIWLWFSFISFILLLVYLYLAVAMTNTSF